MPEAEAIKENISGIFFRIDNANDLSKKIKTFKRVTLIKLKSEKLF